jgi:DeoR/GlpR family transcriptional regulator of sugar metabolism
MHAQYLRASEVDDVVDMYLLAEARGADANVFFHVVRRPRQVDWDRVTVVGGTVRPLSHGLVGPLADLTFARMAFDAAFLGADAVDPAQGLGEPTLDET